MTTPDSLLSETKDTDQDGLVLSYQPLTVSKTPDSALVSAADTGLVTENISTRSAGAGLCLGLMMRKNNRPGYVVIIRSRFIHCRRCSVCVAKLK